MKFILLVALAWFAVWWLRNPRRAPPPASTADVPPPQPMLRCAQCGLNLPRDEALPGRGGVFCSATHRASYEAEHTGV